MLEDSLIVGRTKNGVATRNNKIILGVARAMLHD